MLLVCQSIRPPSLRGWENQAIVATRSPIAIRDERPFRLRRKQIPETSRSGTSTTRRTRSRFLFDLPSSAMGEGPCGYPGERTINACSFLEFFAHIISGECETPPSRGEADVSRYPSVEAKMRHAALRGGRP
jgi:hypothetical protein